MELELQHKTVFITGSTSGIGFAMAEGFLKEGAHVFINGRTQNTVDKAIEKLKTVNPNASITGIVADFKESNAIDIIRKTIKQVDILINNVGIFSSQSFEETTDAEWASLVPNDIFSQPFNFGGVPTLSVPCGFSKDGMPISVQFVGSRLSEAVICRVGHAYEQANVWHSKHPNL